MIANSSFCLPSTDRAVSWLQIALMDSSAGCEDHREQIGLDVEAAPGDTSGRFDLVPGEGSSTGNVTGGREFARYHFVHTHFLHTRPVRTAFAALSGCGKSEHLLAKKRQDAG
jgi:hypothetical protein